MCKLRLSFVAPVLVASILAVTPAVGADLRPDQRLLVEKLPADVEPEFRHVARLQIEQSVIMMTPEHVQMVLDHAGQDHPDEVLEANEAPLLLEEASAEDIAYNRAQYETFIHRVWKARLEFDALVRAELKSKCPEPDWFAVFGLSVRYELPLPDHKSATSQEIEPELLFANGYAPQDGRYDFDFSDIRADFNRGEVSALISKACADWVAEAARFQREAQGLVTAKQFDDARELQQTRSKQLSGTLLASFEKALKAVGPADNTLIMMALQSGNPVR